MWQVTWLNFMFATLLYIMAITGITQDPGLEVFATNKKIPAVIRTNVLKALSHYPELKTTKIRFVFKKNIRKSVMQAQPVFGSLLKTRRHRAYQINISAMFRLTHNITPIHQLPDEILIGWIGHELGHIMDYESRSNVGMVAFGYKYLSSGAYIKQVEV